MLLVTGITGHTGRYFLRELISHEYKGPIRCIVRETSDTTLLDSCGLNIEIVYGDLNDEDFISKAIQDVDVIMHIYNIHHSPMIVQKALENSVERVILVHTTGIYSHFKSASQGYKNVEAHISKLTSRSDCTAKITILRPTMIYGDLCDRNMSKFIKLIDKLRIFPVVNGGRSLIQPVNARDLGKAFYNVLVLPEVTSGKVYNLSGDKPLQMIEVFKMISDCLNKKTLFVNISLEVGIFLSVFLKILTFGKIDYIERVQRMGEDRSCSHNEATQDFDYKPMSFEEGIRIEVSQYLKK